MPGLLSGSSQLVARSQLLLGKRAGRGVCSSQMALQRCAIQGPAGCGCCSCVHTPTSPGATRCLLVCPVTPCSPAQHHTCWGGAGSSCVCSGWWVAVWRAIAATLVSRLQPALPGL
jgi:hypothetical protein